MPLPALLLPIPSEPSDSVSARIPGPPGSPPAAAAAALGAGAFGGLLAPGGSHSTSGGMSATPSLVPRYPGLLFDIPFTDLVLHRKVGTGGFGAVYCADWHMSTVRPGGARRPGEGRWEGAGLSRPAPARGKPGAGPCAQVAAMPRVVSCDLAP